MRHKRGRPRKDEADALKALEYTYILVHLADFIMDKNTPLVIDRMGMAIRTQNKEAAEMVADYLEKRHKAIDHLLATAKPKEKPDGERV